MLIHLLLDCPLYSRLSLSPYPRHPEPTIRFSILPHITGSYLAHTQGKKHQTNLARRAAKENKEQQLMIQHPQGGGPGGVKKKVFVKIGRPGGCFSVLGIGD